MRPIPPGLRHDMSEDPYYKNCCLCGSFGTEWHHNFIYAGRQLNEKWCILPLCPYHHRIEKRKDIKEILNWIMFNRAGDEILIHYSKAVNLIYQKETLNKKYGVYNKSWKLLQTQNQSPF